jgi:hypothetical protein
MAARSTATAILGHWTSSSATACPIEVNGLLHYTFRPRSESPSDHYGSTFTVGPRVRNERSSVSGNFGYRSKSNQMLPVQREIYRCVQHVQG